MNTSDAMAATLATGTIVAVLMGVFVLLLVLWVLLVIAHWRMFQKAGVAGWKSLIPIYSDYVLYKITWSTSAFWVFFAATALSVLFSSLSNDYTVLADGQLVFTGQGNFFLSLLSYAASLVALVWGVRQSLKTAQAYGQSAAFGVGLIFLPNIFALILGFGSAKYVGPQE